MGRFEYFQRPTQTKKYGKYGAFVNAGSEAYIMKNIQFEPLLKVEK